MAKKTTVNYGHAEPLLMNAYKSFEDLLKGTPDERILAAVLYNYPVNGVLNVVHLTNDELKEILKTFTPDEWTTYGFNAAVNDTSCALHQRLQDYAYEFISRVRILHSLVLAHKTARQTADMLTLLLQPLSADKKKILQDNTPTLYGWRILPEGEIKPDFSKDLGGTTFQYLIESASKDVFEAMGMAKNAYNAFLDFRKKTQANVLSKWQHVIYYDDDIKKTLKDMTGYYAPFPEYQPNYKPSFQNDNDNNNDVANHDKYNFFPTWDKMPLDQQKVNETSNSLSKLLSETAGDYARVVADSTGLNEFYLGDFVYKRATH